jgi:hypothetical protein
LYHQVSGKDLENLPLDTVKKNLLLTFEIVLQHSS